MHIFPNSYEGLHPAFPTRSHVTPSNRGLALACFPAVAFLVPALTFRLRSGPLISWSTASTFTAYGALFAICSGSMQEYTRQARAKVFLREQDIAIPPGIWFERIGYFDPDDAVIVGSTCGVIAAARRGRSWSVTGWRRHVAAMSVGGWLGLNSFIIEESYRSALNSPTDNKEETPIGFFRQRFAESQRWTEAVDAAWKRAHPKLSPSAESNSTSMSSAMSSSGQSISNGGQRATSVVAVGTPPNFTNEPHFTNKPSPDSAPIPYANTNYLWVPTPGHAISDLEAHISKLRKRREKMATEAEHLWQWLSKLELDYFNDVKSPTDSPAKPKLRRRLETLGNIHTKIWVEVSRYDWMISDSQKRIEQLRSAETNGRVSWLPPVTADRAKSDWELSQYLADSFVEITQERKRAIEKLRSKMYDNLADRDLDQVKAQLPDPETGEMKPMKEVLRKQLEVLQKEWDKEALDEEVLSSVSKEIKERIRDDGNGRG